MNLSPRKEDLSSISARKNVRLIGNALYAVTLSLYTATFVVHGPRILFPSIYTISLLILLGLYK